MTTVRRVGGRRVKASARGPSKARLSPPKISLIINDSPNRHLHSRTRSRSFAIPEHSPNPLALAPLPSRTGPHRPRLAAVRARSSRENRASPSFVPRPRERSPDQAPEATSRPPDPLFGKSEAWLWERAPALEAYADDAFSGLMWAHPSPITLCD